MTPLEQFDLMSGPLAKFPTTTGRSAEAPLGFGPMILPDDFDKEQAESYLLCKAGIAAQQIFTTRLMVPDFWEGDGKGQTLAIGRETYDEEMDDHGYDGQPPSGRILDVIIPHPETGDMCFQCPRGELSGAVDAVKVERDIEFAYGKDEHSFPTLFLRVWLCITADKSLATFTP